MITLFRTFSISLFLLLSYNCIAQESNLPQMIEQSKKSILPIVGNDPKFGKQIKALGTGVVIGDRKSGKSFILTCEHVISIKDSITRKTINNIKNLYANFNLANDSIISLPLKVAYQDEVNDFALLEYSYAGMQIPKDSLHKIKILILGFEMFDDTEKLKEGESLLYIGYPMSFGVGRKSFPVSRRGIVAQNISNSPTFLMEGFVQGGNSGSPVFCGRNGLIKLTGIAQAYPNEIGEIRHKNIKEVDRFALINPGFTIVRKIDLVSEVLIKKFGFSK